MQAPRLRIGTRGSPLALAQANEVRTRLAAAHGPGAFETELRVIQTAGDRIQDRPLAEAGGKGLFTKEIEERLLAGEIDLAVHSRKDVATRLPPGLAIVCLLEREDVRDALVSPSAASIAALPARARVATSALRRRAQLKRLRPDLQIAPMRGNVDTRLRKLAAGEADATLLAVAGLKRLGLEARITAPLPVDQILPAIAQGAIGIEARVDDAAVAHWLAPLNHQPTALCIAAERAFLGGLDGSCRTPIAGLAELEDGRLRFRGMLLAPDGERCLTVERGGSPQEAIRIAEDAAAELLANAGSDFLATLR